MATTVAAYTKTGTKSSSKPSLDKSVFSLEVTDHELLKRAYLARRSNRRVNTAHTKTRGEVRGGGRKPWRQKGTGRARFGSIRNPIWRGGGVVFGPRPSTSYSRKLNAKSRATALRQALSLAVLDGRLSVIESLPASGKTAELAKLLKKTDFTAGLIVLAETSDEIKRASANLPAVELVAAGKLSAADVLDAPSLLLDQAAVAALTERLKDLR